MAVAVTTAALAPVVLLSTPVFAAGTETASTNPPAPTAPDQAATDQPGQDQAEQDRKTILAIIADPMASEYMKEAGLKAIADGPTAMRRFIETDQHRIRLDDYRVMISRLLIGAGPCLKEGVKELLSDEKTLEELRHFYDVTQHELRDRDNRLEITKLVGRGGPAVKEAGKRALKGTPADRAAFLETGRYLAQAEDDRAELTRIDEAWNGPILSEAISKLLNGPATPAELRHFLEVTQYELRDQDNRVTIAKMINGGGPELVKAARAALKGTAADRVEFLATGQHDARANDEKARQENDKNESHQRRNNSGTGSSPAGTSTSTGAGEGGGNTTVTPQGSTGSSLAATGAGGTTLIAGGAGTALIAGAGLLLAARMRRAGSAR
ncbi:ALF repeat-containing protein [Streptomyces sp. NPDC086787]|uniref:ALF repeat-containing protein n=1 Tax=Streptomyces sp. NPDC086787 TaxID=3365759 RepID=UPI0037F176AD